MAARVSSRIADLGEFAALEPAHASRFAERHDLDYLITEHDIALPLVHREGRFAVYDLRDDTRMARRDSRPDDD